MTDLPWARRLAVPGFADVCFNDPRGTCNKTAARAFRPNGGRGGETPFNWAEMTYLLVSDPPRDSDPTNSSRGPRHIY